MTENKSIRTNDFWFVLLLIALAILLVVAIWLRWFRLSAIIAGEFSHHWVGWFGAGFIGLYLPLYSILKRRYPNKLVTLTRIHVFGNLLSITAIAIHFTHQLTRPPQAYPALGTGVALITALVISIITGFILRFRLSVKWYRSWRWIHTAVILSFYIIAIIHILHGAGIPGF